MNQYSNRIILKENTKSMCPECYQIISAQIYEVDGKVYMDKKCSKHGKFNCLIEKDSYVYKRLMDQEHSTEKVLFKSIAINVTHACNLNCAICYLPNRKQPNMPLEKIKQIISQFSGPEIRISGGEPTIREDLPAIIKFICDIGKKPFILTNGLKLADRKYLRKLKDAGLRVVHFSFNGFTNDVSTRISGQPLTKVKLKALRNLKKENMQVVMSMMLEKGVNEKEVEKIYHFCLKNTRFIHQLRLRTVVSIGKYREGFQKIYISDLINIIGRVIKIGKEDIIDHALSLPKRFQRPCCGVTIDLLRLLLKVKGFRQTKNPFKKIRIIVFSLMPKIGLFNGFNLFLDLIRKKRKFSSRLFIHARLWHDKYTMDVDEFRRCPSAYFNDIDGKIYPFCYGIAVKDKK